ncbi:MAG: hypothetical protein ABII71_06320 [Candidatus Micrarchaeota archaeon]
MKSITVVADDRVGLLADISYILGKSNLGIEGLTVEVIGGKAIVSLETRDVEKAKGILEGNGFRTTKANTIVIKVSNYLRAIGEINEMLAGEKIKVRDFSLLSSDSQDGIFALLVDKPRKATRMLNDFILGSDAAVC